jgi:hypothetical protein
MLFSSNISLFLFLPLYLLLYFSVVLFSRTGWGSRLFPTRILLPNLVLLLLSLFFYYWCSGKFILFFSFRSWSTCCWAAGFLNQGTAKHGWQMMLRGIVSIVLLGIPVLVLSKTQFNPFIYFPV